MTENNVFGPVPTTSAVLDITSASYGARSDGSDAGAAIRAAVVDSLSSNKPVFIPAGTFDVSTYSTAASAIRITGDGSEHLVIEGQGADVSTIRLVSGGNRNLLHFRQLASVTLRNITLDHQGAMQSAGSCLFFDGSGTLLPNLKITTENVVIRDPFGNGILHDGDNRNITHRGLSVVGTSGSHGVSFSGSVSGTTKAITGITQATPGVVTAVAHGYEDDDWVTFASVGGMTEVNGNAYKIKVLTADTFALYNDNVALNTTGFTAYTSGGTAAVELNSRGIFMDDTLVEDPVQSGLNLSSARRFSINNTRVIHSGEGLTHDTGYAGIRVTNDASGGQITNTYVEGMDRGFFFAGILDLTVSNFNFVNIGTQGILVNGSPDRSARIKISNGNIYNPGQRLQAGLPAGQGIRLVDAEDVSISNVDIVADNSQMLNGVMESVSVGGVGQRNIKYYNVTQSGATDTPWVILNGDPGTQVPFTWATKPTAGVAGRQIRITDVGNEDTIWVDTGTRWKPANGRAVLAALDTVSSNIANTDTVVFSKQIPAGVLGVGDRLRLRMATSKSGTTDTLQLSVRIGTAGTTSDTRVWNGSAYLAAANRTGGSDFDIRLESATSVLVLPNSGSTTVSLGHSTVVNAAAAAAVAITDASANALYVVVSIQSSSTNDTVNLRDAQLELVAAGA